MAVPDFQAYAAAPSVIQTGLGTAAGVQAIGAQREQMEAERQRMQEQAAMAPVALQTAQEKLKEQPQAFASEQQLRQTQTQQAAQTIAASKLSMDQIRHNIVRHDLADIYSADPAQQNALYAEKQKEWHKMGADPSEIPSTYNATMQAEAKGAYESSAPVAAQRKAEVDLMKTVLQGRQQVEAARVRGEAAAAKTAATAAAKLPPQEQAFQTAEGQKNSAYFDTINKNADAANGIYNQATKLIGTAGQIPKDMGILRGGKVYLTASGRELLANSRQMIIKLYSQMPHVGRSGNMMLRFIQGSKPGVTMPYQAFVNVAKWYQASAKLAMEKNQMAQVLKQNGITDRNRINNIWDRFEEAYPISDAQGNVNIENTTKWSEFLQANPGVMTGFAGQVKQAPPNIAGKKLPGTVGSVGGTQTVPQMGGR